MYWNAAQEQGDMYASFLLENPGMIGDPGLRVIPSDDKDKQVQTNLPNVVSYNRKSSASNLNSGSVSNSIEQDSHNRAASNFLRRKILTEEEKRVIINETDSKLNKINDLMMKLEDNRRKRFNQLFGKINPLLSIEWNITYDLLNKLIEKRNEEKFFQDSGIVRNIIFDAIENKLFFDKNISNSRIITSYSNEVKDKLIRMLKFNTSRTSLPYDNDYVSNVEQASDSDFVAFIDLSENELLCGVVFFIDEAIVAWNNYNISHVNLLLGQYFNYGNENLGWKIYPRKLNYVLDYIYKKK